MKFKVGDIVYGKPGKIIEAYLDIRFEILSISSTGYIVTELDPSEEIDRIRTLHNNEVDFVIPRDEDEEVLYLAEEDQNDLSWWLDNV